MSLLKYNSIWKWLGNCQCKYQIKILRIGPFSWVIYDLYFKLYKLCISIWILKNKPGKGNNSLVKNVYSHGMLVQSLAKDQVMIRLNSIGILTFLKQSMWNKSENVCLNYEKIQHEYAFCSELLPVVLGTCPALVRFLRRKNLTGAQATFQVLF